MQSLQQFKRSITTIHRQILFLDIYFSTKLATSVDGSHPQNTTSFLSNLRLSRFPDIHTPAFDIITQSIIEMN
jgi:hypothetical protein